MFSEEHKKAFGEKSRPDAQGYPDTGSGIYSNALSYRDWLIFNTNQRNHNKLLDGTFPLMVLTAVAGIKNPSMACLFGYCFILSNVMKLILSPPIY